MSKNGVKTREFVYNKINNLVSSTVDGVMTEYTYNGDRLRETKTTNGITTRHIYNGTDIVADVSSGETTNYVRGIGLIYSENMATGEKRRYDLNAHGDVVKRKNADGTADDFNYRAYGKAAAATPDPFGYCGEYTDSETGMVYLRNRYYDPDMGRFINVDPIYSGANWYAYCNGNPIKYIDPSGCIRTPGYVNGVWCENPDAQEFGENSVAYSSLCTLGEMWLSRTDNRADIAILADQVRNFARQKTFDVKLKLVKKFAPASANATDLVVLAGDSDKAMFASKDMKTAQSYADLIYGKDSDGSQHNALKHTMWNALMTKRYGANYAKMISNSHEFGAIENLKTDQMQQDLMNMDLWNNSVGRTIGDTFQKSHWYGKYNDELAWEIVRQINDKKIWVVNWVE